MSVLKTDCDLIPSARREGTYVFAIIKGEINLRNSPDLRVAILNTLLNPLPHKLILNLADVPHMDSSGIAVFVEALQKIRKAGGGVVLTHLQPRVKGLLEIARLNTIFLIVEDESEIKVKPTMQKSEPKPQ